MAGTPSDRQKRLARLRQLGLHRGTRHVPQPGPKPRPTELESNRDTVPLHFLNYEDDLQHAVDIDQVVAGQVIENEHGQYFSVTARYPLDSRYGHRPLSDLLAAPMTTITTLTKDESWLDLSWNDVLFVDTETTGLEIAAGTIAFLIGVGYVDGSDFVVRQVFMRDFDEEQALLFDLENLCERFGALVSFNGKSFDVPLLENRFILARRFPDLLDGPHFDLLHPARRVWRRRLPNCRLATLESHILGLERNQADVPGYYIPTLYRKYLVDHDARPLAGIFYHNELDIVSMAALAGYLSQMAALPTPPPLKPDPLDVFSVGLWQRDLGQPTAAEATLRLALSLDLPPAEQTEARTALAYLLKRQERFAEAEAEWQLLSVGDEPLLALEELAKHYEWRVKDLNKALKCTTYALSLIEAQLFDSLARRETLAEWHHRRARLERRLGDD